MTQGRSAPVSRDPFDALGNATRRAIVEQLQDGPRSVAEITASMPISQPSVSRHLRQLKTAGLVEDEPAGARRLYRLRDDGAVAVREYMESVWGEAAARFRLAAENSSPQRRRRT
jgi:DNA-binding transcriptional ArsR family regulator